MKKICLYQITFALLLITGGTKGLFYIIKIGGAGPGISWGLASGPLIVGFLIIIKNLALHQLKRRG